MKLKNRKKKEKTNRSQKIVCIDCVFLNKNEENIQCVFSYNVYKYVFPLFVR